MSSKNKIKKTHNSMVQDLLSLTLESARMAHKNSFFGAINKTKLDIVTAKDERHHYLKAIGGRWSYTCSVNCFKRA